MGFGERMWLRGEDGLGDSYLGRRWDQGDDLAQGEDDL